jgi:hypothetical protein
VHLQLYVSWILTEKIGSRSAFTLSLSHNVDCRALSLEKHAARREGFSCLPYGQGGVGRVAVCLFYFLMLLRLVLVFPK